MQATPVVTYAVPEHLMQAIANNLNEQPARSSRGLLNAIEALCAEQEKQRQEAAQAAQREAIEAELKKKLVGKLDEVHTSAPADK